MKRFTFFMVILLCAAFVHADGSSLPTLGSASKVITAYKRKMTDDIPEAEVHLRLLDSNENEFFLNSDVDIPLNARNIEYSALSWVFSGNIYGPLTVTYTFNPMYDEGITTTTATKIIPYDVTLTHTQTRIGNTPIAVNKASGATSYMTNSFTTYKFKYADSVTGVGTKKSITTSAQSISVVYDMSANTVVKTAGDADANYTLDVCDYWNRYGFALVTLKITPEGTRVGNTTKFDDGVYYANVSVEISVNR
ncbi:MAG: hypothetical protein MJ057_06085 [Sphaerochaetaceae bacterium]|nr:hypothetical protein [Sphaerochaetaceae bacterium]